MTSLRVPSVTLLAQATKSAVEYFGKQYEPEVRLVGEICAD
jgi:hypothetical protein